MARALMRTQFNGLDSIRLVILPCEEGKRGCALRLVMTGLLVHGVHFAKCLAAIASPCAIGPVYP